MKIGILGGLSQWSTDYLMLRLRSLFAYSVGGFLLILSVLFPFLMGRSVGREAAHLDVAPIVFFSIAEMCIWFSFIRTWREISRRIKRQKRDFSQDEG